MDMTVVAVEDKTVVAIETPQPFLVSAGAQGPAGPALGTGTGLLAKTGAASYAARAIIAGLGIVVASGDGVAANPTVSVDNTVVTTAGTYSNPAWITALAWAKLTGTPTTVAGYAISDVYTKTAADARYAPIAVPWASLTGTPTTLAGYGIGDAYTKTASDARYAPIAVPWASITGTPTTVAGYAISDVYTKTASDALYSPIAGSASLITVGTITTGAWNAGAVTSSGAVQAASASTLGISTDVLLNRDGIDILALRRGTNAQVFRAYNTFTNASNYERGAFDWAATSNVLTIGAQAAGTGTLRNVSIVGAQILIPDGAGGSTPAFAFASETGLGFGRGASGQIWFNVGGGNILQIRAAGLQLASGNTIAFNNGTILTEDGAANTIMQRNGVNAQTFRVYNTYTNTSNYERAGFGWSSNLFSINAENLGTGSARNVAIQSAGGQTAIGGTSLHATKLLTVQGSIACNTGATTRGFVGVPTWDTSYVAIQNATITESSSNAALAQNSNGATSINGATGQSITLRIGGANGWQINSSSHFTNLSDNTADIGTAGALRPRTGYFGTSVVTVALAATGLITSSGATSGIGYATGAGGTVTQLTSKATAVTLSTVTGQITMNGAALAAGTIVSFTLTNTAIAATDLIHLQHQSGGTIGAYSINASAAAGSATIQIRNNTAGSLSEALVLSFAVIKGVTA